MVEEIQTDFEYFWMQNGINSVGLVDSSSVHGFEEKLEMLVDKWKLHNLDDNQSQVGDCGICYNVLCTVH